MKSGSLSCPGKTKRLRTSDCKDGGGSLGGISRRTFLIGGCAVLGTIGARGILDAASEIGTPVYSSFPFKRDRQREIFYRLPSLLESKEGTLLAACQRKKRSASDWAEGSLALRRSFDNGHTWEDEQVPYDEQGECTFNGNLIEDRERGRIFWVFIPFPKAEGPDWFKDTWLPRGGGFSLIYSDDDGASWSERVDHVPEPNPDGWKGGASYNNTRGVQITEGPYAGRLVAAARVFKEAVHQGRTKGGLVYSDDHGESWRVGPVGFPEQGPINGETSLCEAEDGEVYVNFRNRGGGNKRLYGRSRDGGASFYEEGECEGVSAHGCHGGLDSYPTENGYRPLLLSYPADSGRRELRLYVSKDGGRTFKEEALIKAGPAAYSDLVVFGSGGAGVIWEGAPGATIYGEGGTHPHYLGFNRLSLDSFNG